MHMIARACLALLLVTPVVEPTTASAQCLLCGERDIGAIASQSGSSSGAQPLQIELQSGFNFHRLSLRGSRGDMLVETDTRSTGDSNVNLSGHGLIGHVMIRGNPNAEIDVELPRSIRLTCRDGSHIDIDRLTTDLPQNPRLDANGRLEFSFGAALLLPPTANPGDYSASLSIDANYK